MIKPLYERDKRIPVEPTDLEEASLLVLELGSREAAIRRYSELIALDTDVGYLAASKILAKIERADAIRAWSTSLEQFHGLGDKNEDDLEEAIRLAGRGTEWNGELVLPPAISPIFFLPNSVSVVEAMKRLEVVGSGMIGVMSYIKKEDPATHGFIFFSSNDVVRDYEAIKDGGANVCCWYRSSNDTVTYCHGSLNVSASYALVDLYYTMVLNKTVKGQLWYMNKSAEANAVISEMMLDGYNPLNSEPKSSPFRLLQLNGVSKASAKQKEIGDFRGVHFSWPAVGAAGAGGAVAGSLGTAALGIVAAEAATPVMATTTALSTYVAGPGVSAWAASAGATVVGVSTLGLLAGAGIGLVAGAAVAGFLTSIGWVDYIANLSPIFQKDHIAQPVDSHITNAIKQGDASKSFYNTCRGYHKGFVQSDDTTANIIKKILKSKNPSIYDMINLGAVSMVNNCRYDIGKNNG